MRLNRIKSSDSPQIKRKIVKEERKKSIELLTTRGSMFAKDVIMGVDPCHTHTSCQSVITTFLRQKDGTFVSTASRSMGSKDVMKNGRMEY